MMKQDIVWKKTELSYKAIMEHHTGPVHIKMEWDGVPQHYCKT